MIEISEILRRRNIAISLKKLPIPTQAISPSFFTSIGLRGDRAHMSPNIYP
jgi:hypothetical protein